MPPAQHLSGGSPSMSTNPLVDYRVLYAAVLVLLAVALAGRTWGLGRAWARLPLVRHHRWLLRPAATPSLGYELDDAMWARTVDHYMRRTSHGSTLSGLVHGWVLARLRREDTWTYVEDVLTGDVADVQGGTTEEGIHLGGAMAGTLDLVQRGLTGLETRDGALWLDPVSLPRLSEYGFSVRYQGHEGVTVQVRAGELSLSAPASERSPIDIRLPTRTVSLAPGKSCSLPLHDR